MKNCGVRGDFEKSALCGLYYCKLKFSERTTTDTTVSFLFCYMHIGRYIAIVDFIL